MDLFVCCNIKAMLLFQTKAQDTTVQVKLENFELLQPALIEDLLCQTSGSQGSNNIIAKR